MKTGFKTKTVLKPAALLRVSMASR